MGLGGEGLDCGEEKNLWGMALVKEGGAIPLSRLWNSGAGCLHVDWRGWAVELRPGTGIDSSTCSTSID